ncbi:MAG: helicase-related protein [Nitrososphaerota archaeon]
MSCYVDLAANLDIIYEGEGNKVASEFYIPVLKRTKSYDRLSGFFSADSLVVIAVGLAGLLKNNGRMRLVVGLHDVGPDLIEAYRLSREKAEELIKEIGEKIVQDLDTVADTIAKKRIEALAWMLAEGMLQVKVALPKKTFLGLGNGIFHEKVMIFRDGDGCIIGAVGSANETRYAYELNGENLTIHMSWREGHMEYIRRYIDRFDALWEGRHPDYMVFPLPEVVEKKLREKFYPRIPPDLDPLEDEKVLKYYTISDYLVCKSLVPAAKLIKELGNVKEFAYLGIGPVILHPHQAYAVDYVLSRYPHRIMLADEVGLGKTIEAGAIIKRLIQQGRVKRVLILAPKNLTRQWLEEMWVRFGLRFWLLDPLKKTYVSADGETHPISDENPFDVGGIELVVASWHYARGSRKRDPELLRANKFFDLVVVDEAHHARRKRYLTDKIEATRLYDLISEIGVTSPHILLLTATPVQIDAKEAMDLLTILGLGGPWVHEDMVEKYFKILMEDAPNIEKSDIVACLRMISWFVQRYLDKETLERILRSVVSDYADNLLRPLYHGVGIEQVSDFLDLESVKKLMLAFIPTRWFMVRNTREKLIKAGYTFPKRDVQEEQVELSQYHKDMLDKLDHYLRNDYGCYEKMLKGVNRSVIGFVKSIYHQRFVSSFTSAYLTINNRLEFLRALLRNDREAIMRLASRMFFDIESEIDEDDFINSMEEILNKVGKEPLLREIEVLENLESLLRDYSPEQQSLSDPKLRKVAEVVSDLVNKGNKVLVFSKYTDTVDAVVRFLIMDSFSRNEIAIYTGEGGKLYKHDVKDYVPVTKDEVVKELTNGPIKVLVCSDAAGEGLNLQAASAIVNVDMPWNPAKVEQRIGRIDRLGQRASVVYVRNVWYPESIEAEMYSSLFNRKEIYNIVVGPAQEIISEGLRRALDEGRTFETMRSIVEETIDKVEEIKEKIARMSGIFSASEWLGEKYEFQEAINRVQRFVMKACNALRIQVRIEDDHIIFNEGQLPIELRRWNRISIVKGGQNALTPSHPIVQWLCDSIISKAGNRSIHMSKSVYLIKDFDGLWRVRLIREEEGAQEELDAKGVLSLLDEFLGVVS